eukprot:604178-Amphidinium_carterae.1
MAAEAVGIATLPTMEGRGLPDVYEMEEKVPGSNAHPRFSHRPIHVRQLRRSVNLVRTWLQQSTKDISWSDAADFDDKEQYLLRRIRKLHSVDHAFISQVTVCVLSDALKQSEATHDRERIAQWRKDMMQLGAACRFVRGASQLRSPVVTDVDGTQVVGYDGMNASLQRFWQSVAEPQGTTTHDVTEHIRRRLHTWPQAQEIPVVAFTGETLTKLCARTKRNTAPGPGGWRSGELKQLPAEAMQELSEVMNLILQEGVTPRLWATSWTSFIPKGQGKSTAIQSYRPITVTALTWRIFSKHLANTIEPT